MTFPFFSTRDLLKPFYSASRRRSGISFSYSCFSFSFSFFFQGVVLFGFFFFLFILSCMRSLMMCKHWRSLCLQQPLQKGSEGSSPALITALVWSKIRVNDEPLSIIQTLFCLIPVVESMMPRHSPGHCGHQGQLILFQKAPGHVQGSLWSDTSPVRQAGSTTLLWTLIARLWAGLGSFISCQFGKFKV